MIATRMAADAQRLATAQTASPPKTVATPALEHKQLPVDTETEWKYRGRHNSEIASSQPLPAPTGFAAQKDEGFQKFYRAVVSPTHVRVTAGGRIVPNTRNGASPAPKWKEKPQEGPAAPRGMPEHPPYFFPGFPGAFPGFPMYPGFHPSMVAGGGSMPPMMPIPVGYSMYGGFAVPQFAFNQMPPAAAAAAAAGTRSMSMPPGSAPMRGPLYPGGVSAITASHQQPDKEHTRVGGLGFVKPPQTYGSVNFGHRPVPPRGPHGDRRQSSHETASDAPMKPPQSSIRESEITKKQLEGLRGTLKYVEDQLQYNKHQIDERAMETHAQSLRGLIQRFEATLELLLVAEGQPIPPNPKKDIRSITAASDSATSSGSEESKAMSRPKDAQVKSLHIGSNTVNKNKPLLIGPEADALTTAIGLGIDIDKAPRTNGSLPVTAALAPPFQPTGSTFPALNGAPTAPRRSLAGSGDWDRIAKMRRLPYLVGRLPPGVDPSKVKDSDYIYHRQLTDDEKRARQMYWGFAPITARKGLPKYDGKNFYPPSPVRNSDQSKESGVSSESKSGDRETSSEAPTSEEAHSKDDIVSGQLVLRFVMLVGCSDQELIFDGLTGAPSYFTLLHPSSVAAEGHLGLGRQWCARCQDDRQPLWLRGLCW